MKILVTRWTRSSFNSPTGPDPFSLNSLYVVPEAYTIDLSISVFLQVPFGPTSAISCVTRALTNISIYLWYIHYSDKPRDSSVTSSSLISYTSIINAPRSVPEPSWPALSSSLADWKSTSIAVSCCPDFTYREVNVLAFWCASYAWPADIWGRIAAKAFEEEADDGGGIVSGDWKRSSWEGRESAVDENRWKLHNIVYDI